VRINEELLEGKVAALVQKTEIIGREEPPDNATALYPQKFTLILAYQRRSPSRYISLAY
jgi:hypothetical protein